MIKIFNSAYGRNSDSREIPLDEVNIVTQKINCYGISCVRDVVELAPSTTEVTSSKQ